MATVRRDLTYPEGGDRPAGRAKRRGASRVYADWHRWPHRMAPYGPATYYPVGLMARAAGAARRPDFDFLYYRVGRLQSLAGILGIVLLAALLARRAGTGRGMAWVTGAGLFALWPRLMGYIISYRPDAPMVCLSMAAVWIALGGLESPRRCWGALGCPVGRGIAQAIGLGGAADGGRDGGGGAGMAPGAGVGWRLLGRADWLWLADEPADGRTVHA